MSGLTTHVLDLAAGRPAAEVLVRLSRLTGPVELAPIEIATDGDGRARLLEASQMAAGLYRLEFGVGAHFRRTGATQTDPGFLETVAIEFNLPDQAASHHVPLLVSPFGYSTYRGS